MPIWLISIWHGLQIAGKWTKGNWTLVLMGIGMVLAIIFGANSELSRAQLMKEFKAQSDANKAQLDALRKVQQDHIVAQAAIEHKYQEVLVNIQTNYQAQISSLDSKKKDELRTIIAATHDDPAIMATQINALFGIPIYTAPK